MKYNFSAGPAILPQEVFEQSAQSIINFEGSGLSILEISHRSKEFEAVMFEANQLTKELLGLNDDYEVLFLQGGASSQFFMVPMNFLGANEKAGYVDTGSWSSKAIKEAKAFGEIAILSSSKDKNYTYIPKGYAVPQDLKYLHITSNNTIFGTQFKEFPKTEVPLIADMSSDIFSKPIDHSRFALIYAGAQKNLGPAGVTMVIINKEFASKTKREMPTMLNYNTHIEEGSMYNTPPCFSVFGCLLTLRWIKKNGGLAGMAKRNEAKAKILYDALDRSDMFSGTTDRPDRSLMNVTFVLEDDSLTGEFLKACDQLGCDGLKGHRSVGGFRASIYNAMESKGIETLVELMKDFESKYG